MSSETAKPDDARRNEKKKARIDLAVSASGFASMISAMSKLLNQVSGAALFKEVNLDLNEWTLLNALAAQSRPGKKLIKETGLSKDQGRAMVERLKGKGFVSAAGSDGNLVLTPEGRRQMDTVNDRVTAMLAKFKQKAGVFQKIGRNFKSLSRLMAEPKSPEKKARKKEKKKAREKTDEADA